MFDTLGNELMTGDSWCFRTVRDAARELGTKYRTAKARPPMRYTAEDLNRISSLYESEHIRGAESRWFQDVEIGKILPTMIKGPMTVTGFIAFAQGWGGLYIRANKLAHKQMRKHPGLAIANSLGVLDVPERVHWEDALATDVGTPGAYDYGPERCSWLMHQLTNWMGDAGFLRRHQSQIRHHNVVGDWIAIDATVTDKGVDVEGNGYVTAAQEARNQHGELSATGVGTVHLPQDRS